MLPFFLWGIEAAQHYLGLEPGAMSLAAFHTAFIAVGAALFLPFVNGFSRAIERLLPEKELAPTRYLDSAVLKVPAVALEAGMMSPNWARLRLKPIVPTFAMLFEIVDRSVWAPRRPESEV